MKDLKSYCVGAVRGAKKYSKDPHDICRKIEKIYLDKLDDIDEQCSAHFKIRYSLVSSKQLNIEDVCRENIKNLEESERYARKHDYETISTKYVIDYTVGHYFGHAPARDKKIYNHLKKIASDNLHYLFTFSWMTENFYIIHRCARKQGLTDKQIVKLYDPNKIWQLFDINRVYNLLAEDEGNLRHYYPTHYVNMIGNFRYFMVHLGGNKSILSKLEKLLAETREYYLARISADDINYIYGVTHEVLQNCEFYTKDISQDYVKEIGVLNNFLLIYSEDGFEKYHPGKLDGVIEMALCVKLYDKKYGTKYMNWKGWKKVVDYVSSKIDPKYGILVNKNTKDSNDILSANEHTNILYILLLKL